MWGSDKTAHEKITKGCRPVCFNAYSRIHVPSNTRSLEYTFPRIHVPSNTRSLEYTFPRIHVPSNTRSLEYTFPRIHVPSNTRSLEYTFPRIHVPSNFFGTIHHISNFSLCRTDVEVPCTFFSRYLQLFSYESKQKSLGTSFSCVHRNLKTSN